MDHNIDLIVGGNAPAGQRAGNSEKSGGQRVQRSNAVVHDDEAGGREAGDRIAEERGQSMLAGLACVGERENRTDGISRAAAA